MQSLSHQEFLAHVQRAMLDNPDARLYAIVQPALVSHLASWIQPGDANVFDDTREAELAPYAAYVVSADLEKLRAESHTHAAAIKRAAVWWCLSTYSPTQLARHLYDISQFEDMDGAGYLLRCWDGMVMRQLSPVLNREQWAALIGPMVQMWLPDRDGGWLRPHGIAQIQIERTAPSPDQNLLNKLDDPQMQALMDVAETGQVLGFVRERMPQEVAEHDEYTLFDWANRARVRAVQAGYASTEAAQVYLAAYVQLGLFDENLNVVNAIKKSCSEGLSVADAIAHALQGRVA